MRDEEEGLELRFENLGFGVEGFESRFSGFGFRCSGFGWVP